jgi:hypothetical protein
MFRTSTKVPIYFKKAVIRGIPLSREEIILQTIYNNKAITLKNLWNIIPKEEFGDELTSKNALKEHYLHKMVKKESLIRDKAEGSYFKKGGYAVNLRTAYKEKFPYTMVGLDPLPAFERVDYMYHLILYKDPQLLYKIFPEDKHEFIDKLNSEAVYLAEKLLQEDPTGLFSLDLMEFLNKYDYNYKRGDPNYKFAIERKNNLSLQFKRKLEVLPAFPNFKEKVHDKSGNGYNLLENFAKA